MYTIIAVRMLEAAGHKVTPADGVPGLYDVEGLARDVTLGQLRQLAAEHGEPAPIILQLPGPPLSFVS